MKFFEFTNLYKTTPHMASGFWLIDPRSASLVGACITKALNEPQAFFFDDDDEPKSFDVTSNGVAVIQIVGPMSKAGGGFFFRGASTVDIRRQLREAAASDAVSSILLNIDSPGGTVAGTADLADDVAEVDAIKPIHAHIQDLGASAAFWVASQARRITANRTAEVGSIGTVAVVEDFSALFEKEGIKVHVISTGDMKGAFAFGTEVTEEMLDMIKEQVSDLNDHFQEAVAKGRKLNTEQLASVSDGRVFIAEKAQALGLIDSISTLDDAVAEMSSFTSDKEKATARTNRMRAETLIRLSEQE